MTRKLIPAAALFAEWRHESTYVREHASLEEEFALAAALIDARREAQLTQEDFATRMQTSQQRLRALRRQGQSAAENLAAFCRRNRYLSKMRNIDKVANGLDLPLASWFFRAFKRASTTASATFSMAGA